MTKCPQCFNALPQDTFMWVCQESGCERRLDPTASRFTGAEVRAGLPLWETRPANARRGWRPQSVAHCTACNLPAARACPTCHHPLLADWYDANVVCLAMNGARATGKSLYIAVIVKQMQQMALLMGTTMSPANNATREVYANVYQRPLFVERGLMQPTPRAEMGDTYQREPLVFSMGIVNGKRQYVVIRDVAGEEMENPPPQSAHLGFLAHADGIFFMFDPLAVPDVRHRLVDLVPAQLFQGGDPLVVLGNLLRLIGGAAPRLGVIVSKFDALQALREVDDESWSRVMSNAGAAFMRDESQDRAAYDEDDGALLHEEVVSLLHTLGASELVLTLENPHAGRKIPYRFFAVSALGESPDGDQLHARGIASFRCLDPVKWVFAAVGLLPGSS